MTPAQLKHAVTCTGSHFFDYKTMRFFGDRMANYGVRETVLKRSNGEVTVWELYRRQPVRGGLKKSAYFDQETLEQVFGVETNE